ncbi:DUF4083 family protein [Pontibacillus yanchengensis]|uniref:DUF4083 family protein n=1 Tax=Pontibacillus yanchengensis TaxID=462910 RepID=UPI000AE6267C|nr:DUF4083 family protein [Pontibacillus yanchengensis]
MVQIGDVLIQVANLLFILGLVVIMFYIIRLIAQKGKQMNRMEQKIDEIHKGNAKHEE